MSVQSFSFTSKVLQGNPWNDPVKRSVSIWTPPGAEGPLPVVYGLTGFTGTGAMLLHDGPWSPGLHRRLDRLYTEGKIPGMLVALPDCFTRLGGSQFVNSPATGRYQDYLCDEVIAEVETRFEVHSDRDHRFVFGKSSGGFGAITLGMERAELFGGVACQSGDMAFEYCYLPDFPHTVAALDTHQGVTGFLDAFARAPKKTHDLIRAMNVLAMAACYSPNPDAECGFDLPFEVPTGRLRPAVWERWLAWDPVRRAENSRKALASLKILFIDCGFRDEFNLHLGARMFHETLDANHVPHTHEEFDDGHMNISYRYERALTVLGGAWR